MINTFDVYASDLQTAMNMLKSAGAHYYTKPNAGSYSITILKKLQSQTNITEHTHRHLIIESKQLNKTEKEVQ